MIKEKIRLDIGCGNAGPREGFVGVDIRNFEWVKYSCNAWELDKYLADGEVEEIYSRHFFEHLTFPQAEKTLICWHKILRDGGRLQIIIPDIRYHIDQFLDADPFKKSPTNPEWSMLQHALAGFWGWQNGIDTQVWDVHKSGYDFRLLKMKLEEFGFKNIERIDDEVWNLNVICEKTSEFVRSEAMIRDRADELLSSERVREKINNFIQDNKGKRVFFYGAGKLAEKMIEKFDFSSLNIAGFIDGDKTKTVLKLKGYNIYHISDIKNFCPEIIAIAILNKHSILSNIKFLRGSSSAEIVHDLFDESAFDF